MVDRRPRKESACGSRSGDGTWRSPTSCATHVDKRFARIGRQVSELATLEVELTEERNPSIRDSQVAEATLHLKGMTLRASEASPEMLHSIHEVAEDIRRQVKRHREKRRKPLAPRRRSKASLPRRRHRPRARRCRRGRVAYPQNADGQED